MSQQDILSRAIAFATQAHGRIDHRRRYTHQPYDVHLRAVAELVTTVTDDPEVIAAAWLHDAVEDTPATHEDIEREFGPRVAQFVRELTDVSRPADGNRAVRKAIDREHLARASAEAQTVKLADLIDNAQDIIRHDPGFAPRYVSEAEALLPVLAAGDPRLRSKAETVMKTCRRDMSMAWFVPEAPPRSDAPWPAVEALARQRATGLFLQAFTAGDIAEPLASFDAGRSRSEVVAEMGRLGLRVAGVRTRGSVDGWMFRDDPAAAEGIPPVRAFAPDQILAESASLPDTVEVLLRHTFAFVTGLGGVAGVVTRADMQKPVVRMWLFGILTIFEMELVADLRARHPGDDWVRLLTPARLEKARDLHAERQRRGQECDLLDCVQFSDKLHMFLADPRRLEVYGFPSRATAKRTMRELESLRNNLAHSQDIVTHDWPQIARLARRVQEFAEAASAWKAYPGHAHPAPPPPPGTVHS